MLSFIGNDRDVAMLVEEAEQVGQFGVGPAHKGRPTKDVQPWFAGFLHGGTKVSLAKVADATYMLVTAVKSQFATPTNPPRTIPGCTARSHPVVSV